MFNLICLILGGITSAIISISQGVFFEISKVWIFPILWLAFTVLSAILIFLILFIVSLFFSKKSPDKPNKACYLIVRLVIGFLCFWGRIKVHVKNGELIEKGKSYLLVSNHRSNFDPIIQFNTFVRCKPIMISKPENMKIPLAGPFINKSGFLAIDRENDREALKTVLKAIKFIKNHGVSVGVCPEGTRNKTGRDLLPLKVGALKIATKANVPIAVMTFEGTEKISKNFPFKRSHGYVDVLKVITPEEYKDKSTQEIGDEIARLMQENIDRYSSHND